MIKPPANKTGGAAIENANEHVDKGGRDANKERHARTFHEPGQHVAAQIVGAQWVPGQLYRSAFLKVAIRGSQTLFDGLVNGDDPADIHFYLLRLSGFAAVRAECDHGVVIVISLQIKPIFKVRAFTGKHFPQGQAKRAFRANRKNVSVDAIAIG